MQPPYQSEHIMQPSFPIPTDNIYKFGCLFGLVLIVSSIFSFVSSYSSALDRKVRYSEIVIPLEAKSSRTKIEEDLLTLNKKLIEVTRSNEKYAAQGLAAVLGVGIALSAYGARKWYRLVQIRDDRIAELQLRKLAAEVAKLEAEVEIQKASRAVGGTLDSKVPSSLHNNEAEEEKSDRLESENR